MNKQKYELSLWDTKNIEKKIAILASDDLNSLISAYNINYTIKQNGEKTLTFSLHYKYIDIDGIEKNNIYAEYIMNGARLKLRDGEAYTPIGSGLAQKAEYMLTEDNDERWSDFEITEVNKDSKTFELQVTAKELYANELGRNGWQITLDTELENNYGTASELAAAVLKGSNWDVAEDSYNPIEKISEPLFLTQVTKDIIVSRATWQGETEILIPAYNYIYPFYSCLKINDEGKWELNTDEIQFLWAGDKKHFTRTNLDDNLRIIDDDLTYNYCISKNELTNINNIIVTGCSEDPFNIHLTGYKIAKQQSTHLCTAIDKYVYDWRIVDKTKAGAPADVEKAMSYMETSYGEVAKVSNLINNSTDFKSYAGWEGYYLNANNEAVKIDIDAEVFPKLPYIPQQTISDSPKRLNYLKLDYTKENTWYINKGPYVNALEVTKDEIYVIRARFRWKDSGTDYDANFKVNELPDLIFSLYDYNTNYTFAETTLKCENITPRIIGVLNEEIGYPVKNGTTPASRIIYNDNLNVSYHDENGYYYIYMKVNSTSNKIDNKLYLKITSSQIVSDYKLYIEDMQFFKYVKAGISISLKDKITYDTVVFPEDAVTSIINENELFFYIDENKEVQYLSSDKICYEPIYPEGYASVRNLSVSKSNYFNNIQEIAELFQIWVKFKVYHDKIGNLLYNNKGIPRKEIKFSRYSPNGEIINYAGFKNGINEQSISRVMNSDEIATKVIVSNNNQEYAKDGSCSITRAKSNVSGENTIYNFSYFIEKGLIDESELNNDIYGIEQNDIGLYSKIKILNNQYNILANQAENDKSIYDELEAKLQILEANIQSLDKQTTTQRQQLNTIIEKSGGIPTGMDYYDNIVAVYNENIASYQKKYPEYISIKEQFEFYNKEIKELNNQMEIINNQKQEITDKFYAKYYQFIREGTWSDDEYIDDELYYLDGLKIAETSAYPKVTYTINVSDILSAINNDYSDFNFEVGERTYVEDGEFFGYKSLDYNGNTYISPNKIEVIVTENKRVLDNPSTSTITVKNYKNQFEELFQKITAQTQQLSYQAGSYERAANAVLTDGSINGAALTSGLSNPELSLGANESFVWNTNNGITMTNILNTNEKIKLIGSGLYCSNDGGETWATGITGDGINAEQITTGTLDVDKIVIYNQGSPLFKWNKDGLHAYVSLPPKETNSEIRSGYINYNQYGLYGTDDPTEFEAQLAEVTTFEEKLEKIRDNASFALTWKGLNINDSFGTSGTQMELSPGVFTIKKADTILFGIDSDTGSVIFGSSSTQGSGLSITEARLGGDEKEAGNWLITKYGFEIDKEQSSPYSEMFWKDANGTSNVIQKVNDSENIEVSTVFHIQDKFNIEEDGKAHIYNPSLYQGVISGNFSPITDGGATLGTATYKLGKCYASAWATSSSKKLKENIAPLPNYNIDLMEPIIFNYKGENSNDKNIGFVAEDMYAICPEVVTLENGEPAGINYSGLIPVLVKEIQDLRRRVAELEKKIN